MVFYSSTTDEAIKDSNGAKEHMEHLEQHGAKDKELHGAKDKELQGAKDKEMPSMPTPPMTRARSRKFKFMTQAFVSSFINKQRVQEQAMDAPTTTPNVLHKSTTSPTNVLQEQEPNEPPREMMLYSIQSPTPTLSPT